MHALYYQARRRGGVVALGYGLACTSRLSSDFVNENGIHRVRPLAISLGAVTALQHHTPIIRAVHDHGLSLAVEESSDDIFVGAPGRGLLPVHIVVRSRDLVRLQVLAMNAPSRAALRIDGRGVRLFAPRLACDGMRLNSRRARDNIEAIAAWLCSSSLPLGLGASADVLLQSRTGEGDDLLASLRCGLASDPKALLRLIGRGCGSTPAGDDMIIGALAWSWAYHGEKAPLITAGRALSSQFARRTTVVSATYLRAALRGEFGSHLGTLIRSLPQEDSYRAVALAARVARHGATSGRDTLVGLVMAARQHVTPCTC